MMQTNIEASVMRVKSIESRVIPLRYSATSEEFFVRHIRVIDEAGVVFVLKLFADDPGALVIGGITDGEVS